ncbi:MAG: hypothetical protein M0R37_13595, partial [Bacteroidales bacterium]|nr:hypothetical protein [Bacteroidales bacterium]
EPTRLDALIKKWESGAGFHLDDAEEFIRLAIARLDDLCSGPHLSLASTEELLGALLRRVWDDGTRATLLLTLTTGELRDELKRRGPASVTCIDEFANTDDTEPAAPVTERVRVDDAWIANTARSSVTELFDLDAFKAWAAESKRKREAKCDLDHLEILAERREDLLREMLESLSRIEESLIVAKPPSWKECDHAWVETTGGKRCNICGVTIMPRLT